MKKIITYILLLFVGTGFAQQTTQYSQWSYNQFSINPALAGIKRCLDVKMGVRGQWIGFEGAPISGLITINAPLQKKSKGPQDFFHGLGGKIERDQFGPFNNFSVGLAYAAHIPLGNSRHEHRLSLGLMAGIQQFGFDQSKVSTINPDLAVAQSANQLLAPLISFGAFYYSKLLYGGISIDQLGRNKWKDVGYSSRFRLHTKIQVGTKFTFDNNNSLLPGVLFRIPPGGPMSVDLNLMFDYQNIFNVGIGYRNVDAFIGFFKVNIRQFAIGYSFDFITSAVRGGNFHTHELSIHFNGCKQRARRSTACPMFE